MTLARQAAQGVGFALSVSVCQHLNPVLLKSNIYCQYDFKKWIVRTKVKISPVFSLHFVSWR